MLDVLLFTTQPVLVCGVAAAFAQEGNCRLSDVCSSVPLVLEALARERFGVVLLEATADITISVLAEIQEVAQGIPVVLWVDNISTDFIAQAVGLGVRGVLRKNLSLELQIRCLEKVGGGELWVDKALIASLLSTKRITLTPRELQLVALLAQGLKNKEVAHRLGLSEGTVKVYFSRLFQKVGVSDRFELALYAIGHLFAGRSIVAEPQTHHLPVASPGTISGPALIPKTEMMRPRLGYN